MNKDQPVLIPGDIEKANTAMNEEAGGVKYVYDQMMTCERLAKELKVQPMQPLQQNEKTAKPGGD